MTTPDPGPSTADPTFPGPTYPGDALPDSASSGTTIEPGLLTDIGPGRNPEMKTLVYSPDVRIVIARGNKQYDVSADIVACSLRRVENSVSSAVFRLANKMDPSTKNPRYHMLFERMDRVAIFLKRVEWIQVFSGYLDSVPYVQLYPGTVNFRASCTLKRLVHTWWDPGLSPSMSLFAQAQMDNRMNEIDGAELLSDSGLGSLLRQLLYEVGKWDLPQIHIQRFPPQYYMWMEQQLRRYKGTEAEVKKFRTFLLGGGDQSGGVGVAAGRETGVSRGSYVLEGQAARQLEVIRAVDEMGMGPRNYNLALAQGLNTGALGGSGTGGNNEPDPDVKNWNQMTEVGSNAETTAKNDDAAIHCFMTIMVESGWTMFANLSDPASLDFPHEALSTDGSSVGLYQQQNNGAWGTTAQRMNVRESTGLFLKALKGYDWNNMPKGDACQAVQRSGFPYKYAPMEEQATNAVRAIRMNILPNTPSSLGTGDITTGLSGGPSSSKSINLSSIIPSLPNQNGVPTPAAAGALVGGPQYDTAGAIAYAMAQIGKPYQWGASGPLAFDCITEGSLVATSRGEVPIEEVTDSDFVMTRRGYRRVLRSWKVRDDAEVLSVEVGGRILSGTPDHRVWTENRGWVPLSGLERFDIVVLCRTGRSKEYALSVGTLSGGDLTESIAAKDVATSLQVRRTRGETLGVEPTRLSSTGSRITDTLTHPDLVIEHTINAPANPSMLRYGSTITDPCLPGSRSIMSTTTPSTTRFPISIVSRHQSIVKRVKRLVNCTITSVLSAGRVFRRFVPHSVSDGSAASNINKSSITTEGNPRRSVYDLWIEGEHEFFANGVLVHNCSGLTQMAYRSIGMEIGRTTYDQYSTGQKIAASQLMPGDLIQPNDGHTFMWAGNGAIIEAQQTGTLILVRPYVPTSNDVCLHFAGAHFGGNPAFNPLPQAGAPGVAPGTAAQGSSGGTYQTGAPEPIARNIFSYLFEPGTFASKVGLAYQFGGDDKLAEKAFINDEPLIQMVVAMSKAGLRNFCSAPNGDFVAYYPDYFGLDGKRAVLRLEDIELKNGPVAPNDDAWATHV